MPANADAPVRLVLLTTYYHPVIGGVETHARQIAAALRQRGLDVTVVTRRLEDSMPQPPRLDDVPIERVGPRGGRTRFAKWSLLPFAFAALARRTPPPNVIFCPDYRGIGIAALAASAWRRCPVVLQAATPGALSCESWDPDLTRYGIAPDGWLGRGLKWPVRRIYTSATMYTCISREIYDEALRSGVSSDRLQYIPHGVDTKQFQPASPEERRRQRAALGWAAERPVCLFVGRLSVEKGVLDLLAAWATMTHRDARLVIAGPDMPGHSLDAGARARAFVAREGLQDRVTFTGPATDVAALMQAADVFVQPSHYEAFGISAIEALACGLPVVATRVGGMVDYLVHEKNALLCAQQSPAELAHAIDRLLDDTTLRHRLATSARDTAVRLFDQEKIADRYSSLFRELAQGIRPVAKPGAVLD